MSTSPEAEERAIQRAAKFIVDHDLADFTIPILEAYGRTELVGTLGFGVAAPWAAVLGPEVFDIVTAVSLDPRENSKRLIEKIKVFEEEKKRLEELKPRSVRGKGQESSRKSRVRSFIDRLLGR